MKQSAVIVLGLAAIAIAGPAALIGSAVSGIAGAIRGKGKRDVEYEDALLVVRSRTIDQWSQAVHNPSMISGPMIAALRDRGYTPPEKVLAQYQADPSGQAANPGDPITKSFALDSIKKGYPIPQDILDHMSQAGWTGPGITPAAGKSAPGALPGAGAPGLPKRSEFFDEYDFETRSYDDDDVDLFIRDFYEFDY